MKKYLLDTNHLADGIGKVSRLRDRLHAARREGHRLATSWTALLELELGIVQTSDPEGGHRRLRTLLDEVRIRPIDFHLMQTLGSVHMLLKQRGRVLSLADKVLAALAMNENAVILTSDLDFQGIPEVRTENWLV